MCKNVQQQMCEQSQRNTANTNTQQGLHDYTRSPMQSQVILHNQRVTLHQACAWCKGLVLPHNLLSA